jgi:hypothetical protein
MVDPLSKMVRLVEFLFSRSRNFLTYYPPGHYHSPIPDLDSVLSAREVIFDQSVKDIPSVDLNEQRQVELLELFSKYYKEGLPFPERPKEGVRYYFENNFFSYGDAVILYAFLRQFRPRRVIEVGSGFSSGLMLDVKDHYFLEEMDFVFIEPHPDRLYTLFSEEDKKSCQIIDRPVQEVEIEFFFRLEAGDLLFIDSSHVGKVYSDVGYILNTILPALKRGVFVHFHDIPWPFEYPEAWFRQGRVWNEAYMIRSFLQYNESFEIMYFNSMMERKYSDLLKEKMPMVLKAPISRTILGNSSLWMKKRR